jgi:hypothetical protein
LKIIDFSSVFLFAKRVQAAYTDNMEPIKRKWQGLPSNIRKPIVFIVGMLFVIASVLTGWLPGPGGIPLFLIGIAILATEFAWALRLRDRVMTWIRQAGKQYNQHKIVGTLALIICAGIVIGLSVMLYRQLH